LAISINFIKKGREYVLVSATCLHKTGSETGLSAQNLGSLLDAVQWTEFTGQKFRQESRTGFKERK